MYGAFFLIGLVSALASSGNVIAAAHGPIAYLLNASTGLVVAQQNLGENVTCITPYANGFIISTSAANLTHFVIVSNNTFVPVQNIVEGNNTVPALTGTSESCATYEGIYVVTVESNGTIKAYFFKLNGTNLVLEKEVEAPEPYVKGEEALLFYGPTGLYLYKNGNFTMITNTSIKDADSMGGVVAYISNNELKAYSLTANTTLYTWKPKEGKACAVVALSPNVFVVGLKDSNMGLVTVEGGNLKVSVGIPNVYMLAKGKGYVAAATSGPMGNGVAAVPLSWLLPKK